MAYLSTATRIRLLAQLATIETQIENANATLTSLTTQEIESYTLNTGEASQSAKRWDGMKIEGLIRRLEIRAEHIRQRLAGLGVVNMNTRRKEGM
jgi:hypothetical protein